MRLAGAASRERSIGPAIVALAGAAAALLFVVPLWHLVIDPQTQRAEGYALAALLLGLGAMTTSAAFPYPLIG